MRRLLILTAVTVLTASAVGCGHLFNRGASCGQTYQPAAAVDPCLQAPAVTVPADGTVLPYPG